MSRWFGDIRWWIVLFFAVRLINISQPPLEIAHNWRQTTVTMVARNFLEVDNNPLYPRIDIAGDLTGITGMEFPLLNYLIYLVSSIFGYEHWYGRAINLVVTTVGLWFFYKLVRLRFEERVAFFSTLLLGASVWFRYGRKIMPDTFSMSLIIIGLYFGIKLIYEHRNQWRNALLFLLLTAAGLLSKLPSGYLLIVLALPVLDPRAKSSNKIALIVGGLLALVPVAWWYFYWSPHLTETYGFWHFFMGKPISQGLTEIIENGAQVAARFYDSAFKYSGFVLFAVGLTFAVIRRQHLLLRILGLSSLAFAVVVIKGGWTFAHHEYYIVPFVPVLGLAAGWACASVIPTRWVPWVLLVFFAESLEANRHDFFTREHMKFLKTLESDLDAVSQRSDLFLINSGQYPTPMYFAHRKGWVAYNREIEQESFIGERAEKGLKYVIILKKAFGTEIDLDLEIVSETKDYVLYRAGEP